MQDAGYWIEKLQLQPHPEGGFYRQTYRSNVTLATGALPESFKGDRSVSTAIYFLLAGDDFSAFHRIASDELWHFYAGSAVAVSILEQDGSVSMIKVGAHPEQGEVFQAVAPAGCWFASCLLETRGFALVGCTVAPGFDFAEFEMAKRSTLLRDYPQHADLIRRLTREND